MSGDLNNKRKAEAGLNGSAAKTPKRDVPYTGSGPKAAYKGTGPKAAAPTSPANKATAKPLNSTVSAGIKRPGSAPASGGARPPPASPALPSAPAAPPKKGSYAEIMARAKQQPKSGTVLGAIKHKPTEKPTEKLTPAQRKAKEKEEAMKRRREIRERQNGKSSRSHSPTKSKPSAAVLPQKPKREPTDLGYKGTMRPAPQQSYKGTIRPTSGASSKKPSQDDEPSRKGSKVRMAGYASYSENDSDEMEEDWDDLSDMEAGMDEVEEEELASARVARKEDLEALRQEEELKRKKMERKKAVALRR